MQAKWLFGAFLVMLIPSLLLGGIAGGVVGGRPTLIQFENLVEKGAMTQEEFENLSEMQKFMLQTRPGYPGSGRFWTAFFVAFALTETLGLTWLFRRREEEEPDDFGRLVWQILANRRRRRHGRRSPDS